MAEVFISHASDDREIAERVVAFLEGEGISCWIAPRDVRPGQEYGTAIIEAIERSGAVVLILSEHSNESQFVHKEVERAISKTKPVLPVRVREVAPAGALEFFVSSAQWVDAWRPPIEAHLAQLAATLKTIGGAAPPAAPLAPQKARRRWPLLAALAALLLVTAGGGLYLWAPWQPAWKRASAKFLAGSWCQPMSGTAFARIDYVEIGGGAVRGETHFSNSTDVVRFRMRVSATPDGIELNALEPAEGESAGPVRYRVLDTEEMALVFADGKPQELEPMHRCPPGSGD